LNCPGTADIVLNHPWRAFLASVGKALVAWLLLTAAAIAIAPWFPEGEIQRSKPAIEIKGIDTPLWSIASR